MSTHNYSTFEDLNSLFTTLGGKLRGKPTAVELTKAEYDALSSADKQDASKIYYITDYSPSGSGGAIINDTTIATTSVWSSQKTHDYIDGAVASAITNALSASY